MFDHSPSRRERHSCTPDRETTRYSNSRSSRCRTEKGGLGGGERSEKEEEKNQRKEAEGNRKKGRGGKQ